MKILMKCYGAASKSHLTARAVIVNFLIIKKGIDKLDLLCYNDYRKQKRRIKMNDFEKLMVLLKVPQDRWESLFNDFCNHNLSLIIDFDKNGSISWGTL